MCFLCQAGVARRVDGADGVQDGGDRRVRRGAVEFLRENVPDAQGGKKQNTNYWKSTTCDRCWRFFSVCVFCFFGGRTAFLARTGGPLFRRFPRVGGIKRGVHISHAPPPAPPPFFVRVIMLYPVGTAYCFVPPGVPVLCFPPASSPFQFFVLLGRSRGVCSCLRMF